MLQNTPTIFKPNDAVTIRLVSGDEIVGRFVSSMNGDVTLDKPVLAVMQPTGRGEMGLMFAPFLASAEENAKVTIPEASILCRPLPTRKDVAKGYLEATSSILQPESPIKL